MTTRKTVTIMIGTYVIDASITESHVYESQVTEFPVEQGSAISDNIRPKPIMVTIEGIVSDTPIGKMIDQRNAEHGDSAFLPTTDAATAKARGDAQSAPSTDALAAMLAIRDARQPVPITTSLANFENMVLINLEVPRDVTTGSALRFTATFQQITIVTNQRVLVRTSTARTSRPGDRAKQTFTKAAAYQKIQGRILVFTKPLAERSQWIARGFKVVSTDGYGDHYTMSDSQDPRGDGTVTPFKGGAPGGVYQPFAASSVAVGGYSNTKVPGTINGRPVHFDPGIKNADGTLTPSGGTWVDDKNNSIVKTVPAGMNKWNFASSTFGKNG